MTSLPKHGVRAVVENLPGFQKAMDTINKRIEQSAKAAQEAAKNATPLDKMFNKLGLSVDGLRQKLLEMAGARGPVVNALTQILGALGPLGLAIAAVTAGIAAFVALGVRGANLRGLAESFDQLTASVGILSQTMLTDLRRAAAGTISDFELIRQTNFALAGATGRFGQEFGKNLPRLLEIARAQARATGQDVKYLFESIVLGLKRQSPLILDNLGFVIKLEEANRRYAESIGKTTEQLTAEEKQIALLNALLEAGQLSVEQAANIQETAAEKLARSGATITNIFDKLALAVQPAFELVLDVVNRILSAIDQLVTAVSPLISMIVTSIVQPFTTAASAVLGFIQPLIDLAANTLPYVIGVFQIFQNAIGGVINFLWGLIEPIVRPIIDAFNRIGAFLSNPENVRALFMGGARMIGALANGMMDAANRYVFPTVIQIATFIADFLMGLSPPPKGPLSTIDKGGANLMLAWLEGIAGVSLDPVKQVAAEVSAALGDIGRMTLPQVEARLAQLDRALQPFQDRLEIVKSRFEAIQAPAEAALRAIDRQMDKAVEALLRGDEQAAATVRQLDAQRAAIEAALDGQQELVDAAQIQLSLAQAQQAQERTLLEIRKRMLGPVKAVVDKAKEITAGPKPKEEKAPAGGQAPAAQPGGGVPGIPADEQTDVLDLIGGQGAVDQAIADLQQGFLEGFDPATVGLFNENLGALQTQLGRIGQADIGGRIRDRLGGLFDPSNPDSITAKITDWVDGIVNPERERSIPWFFNVQLPGALEEVRTNVENAFNGAFENVRHFFQDAGEGTLDGLFKSGEEWFRGLAGRLMGAAGDLWTQLDEGIFLPIRDFFTLQTEDATTLWGILTMGVNWFKELPGRIVTELQTLWQTIVDGPLAPFIRFFSGAEEYTLQWYLQQAVDFFAALPQRIVDALQGLGLSVWNSIAAPVINAINGIIAAVETALNSISQAAANVLDQFADVFDFVRTLTPGGGLLPAAHDMAALIRATQISLPRVSVEPPAFLTGAATGGIFGLRVGERGEEIIASAQRLAVFPNAFVQAVDSLTAVLSSVVAQPAPLPVMGGNTTYNDNHSIGAVNIYGVRDGASAYRRFSRMKAGRR